MGNFFAINSIEKLKSVVHAVECNIKIKQLSIIVYMLDHNFNAIYMNLD